MCVTVHASRDLVMSVCDSVCPCETGIHEAESAMFADSPL